MDLRELPGTTGVFRRHPWEVVRANFFRDVLRSEIDSAQVKTLLDVGAGDGWLASRILGSFPGTTATCWDVEYVPEVIERLDAEFGDRIKFTVDCPEKRFDLLLLLDLLEHVDDDSDFLSGLVHGHMTQDAYLLASVPAWQSLYTSHDATFSHRRRYSPKRLKSLLNSAGLEIVVSGGLFHGLLFPRVARKFAETILRKQKYPKPAQPLVWKHNKLAAMTVEAVLGVEGAISFAAAKAGLCAPGLSTWALCRRRR